MIDRNKTSDSSRTCRIAAAIVFNFIQVLQMFLSVMSHWCKQPCVLFLEVHVNSQLSSARYQVLMLCQMGACCGPFYVLMVRYCLDLSSSGNCKYVFAKSSILNSWLPETAGLWCRVWDPPPSLHTCSLSSCSQHIFSQNRLVWLQEQWVLPLRKLHRLNDLVFKKSHQLLFHSWSQCQWYWMRTEKQRLGSWIHVTSAYFLRTASKVNEAVLSRW